MSNPERFQCTKATPWKPAYGRYVEHDNTHEVGEQRDGYPGGDWITVECRNCGHRWEQELPQ
jgi:hypothetical protein